MNSANVADFLSAAGGIPGFRGFNAPAVDEDALLMLGSREYGLLKEALDTIARATSDLSDLEGIAGIVGQILPVVPIPLPSAVQMLLCPKPKIAKLREDSISPGPLPYSLEAQCIDHAQRPHFHRRKS